MDIVTFLFLGAVLCVLGCINLRGNISTIHWYNRTKVREEDAPRYGRWMGGGTCVIGVSLLVIGILRLFFPLGNLYWIVIAGVVIGLTLMLCGQIKYNRGIF